MLCHFVTIQKINEPFILTFGIHRSELVIVCYIILIAYCVPILIVLAFSDLRNLPVVFAVSTLTLWVSHGVCVTMVAGFNIVQC